MSIGFVWDGKTRPRPVVVCSGNGAKQAFKDQCDIVKIVKRHAQTGMVEHLNAKQPFYGDVSNLRSFQESLEVVSRASDLFLAMSADVRERFKNDPAEMIAFLSDAKNLPEAERLGMVVKRPVGAPEAPKGGSEAPKPPEVK